MFLFAPSRPPSHGNESFHSRSVNGLRSICICSGVEEVVDVFGADISDWMNSLMPAQTIRGETSDREDRDFAAFRRLILDGLVERRSHRLIWQFDGARGDGSIPSLRIQRVFSK